MPALIQDIAIVFIGRSVGPEGRDELNQLKREARAAVRQAASRLRPIVRNAAPNFTSRMRRSFRIKSTKAPRGGVAARLTTGQRVFYASFTNTENRSTIGWFDRSIESHLDADFGGGLLGAEVRQLAPRFGALIARRIYKQFLNRRLTGDLRITNAGFHIRPVSFNKQGGSGLASVLNFNIG